MRRILAFLSMIPGRVRDAFRGPIGPAFALLLAVSSLALSGCSGRRIVDADAVKPASIADVNDVRKEVAEDREKFTGAIAAVEKDLAEAKIATPATTAAKGDLVAHAEDVASRPGPSGVGGALVNALGGSLPPWLDWCLTLLTGGAVTGTAVNRSRNKTRAAALAKVAATKTAAPPAS